MDRLWAKLHVAKRSLKILHKMEFAGIYSKIKSLEMNLYDIQSNMRLNPLHTELYNQKKDIICNLRYWRGIERYALH